MDMPDTKEVKRSFDNEKRSRPRTLISWLLFVLLIFLMGQIVLNNPLFGMAILIPAVLFAAFLSHSRRMGSLTSFCMTSVHLLLYLYFGDKENPDTVMAMCLATLIALVTGCGAALLSERLWKVVHTLKEREMRAVRLSAISTDLLTAGSEESLAEMTLSNLYAFTGRPCAFYDFSDKTTPRILLCPEGLLCYPTEIEAAKYTFFSGKTSGFGTQSCSRSGFRYFPVSTGAGEKVLAVVSILCDYKNPPSQATFDTVSDILIRVGVSLDNLRLLHRQQTILIEKELEHMRTDFMRALSHDFRTPLTAIIGACSALNEEDVNLNARDRKILADSIGEEASWLLNMVENLLSVTRIESSQSDLHKSTECIEEILTETASRMRKRFPNLDLHISSPEGPLFVPADAMMIIQVLMNLIENAVKYSALDEDDKKPRVDVIARKENEWVAIRIRDYGPGLGKDRLEDPFAPVPVRLQDRNHQGMGLGLSICRSIILAHDGQISACNHPEGGALFTVRLPKTKELQQECELYDRERSLIHG